MTTPDELMSVELDEKNIVVKIPIDLLIHAQGFRESPFIIEDEDVMAEYFKKYFLNFNRRQYEDVGSDFEILLDDFFEHAFEMGEIWLSSPEEMELDENEDE